MGAMRSREFKPLFLTPRMKKRTVSQFFEDVCGNLLGMGNHDGYLELESQLADRGAFPRELWEAGFGNDLQQIEAICMDLKTDCCWKNPFFIPEDPIEKVLLGNGDYESYFTILCSVEKYYGIK